MWFVNLIQHWLGLTNPSGKPYLFWSGFFGDVTIFGAGIVVIRHKSCHVKGCYRIGHHDVEGTPYRVCRRHHPDIPDSPPTAADIRGQSTT